MYSHLGNELCHTNKNVLPLNAVNDLNCRLNFSTRWVYLYSKYILLTEF